MNITRISTVKLVFSFCANAKFKDIACIVNHHYHIFHVPRQFYSVNRLSITHDPRLRKYCILSDLLTPPRGEINWCQTCLGNTAIVCQHFHTQYTGKIFVSHSVVGNDML